jgi:hypothetical protein
MPRGVILTPYLFLNSTLRRLETDTVLSLDRDFLNFGRRSFLQQLDNGTVRTFERDSLQKQLENVTVLTSERDSFQQQLENGTVLTSERDSFQQQLANGTVLTFDGMLH